MADTLEAIKQIIYAQVDREVVFDATSWRHKTDLLSLYTLLKLSDKLDTVVIDAGAYVAISCRTCGLAKSYYINSDGLTHNDIERLVHEIKCQPRCECEK